MAGPDTDTRRRLAAQSKAMPDKDGSGGRFPIRNATDLAKAIQAVGRAKGGEQGRRTVRRYIIRRAKELSLSARIPDNWAADGSLKTPA